MGKVYKLITNICILCAFVCIFGIVLTIGVVFLFGLLLLLLLFVVFLNNSYWFIIIVSYLLKTIKIRCLF